MAVAEPEPEPTPGIHPIVDLATRSAGMVEEVRHGVVRLRAADGHNIVLLAEQQHDELVRWAGAVPVAT